MNYKKQWEYLEKLSFERVSATDKELEACQLIQSFLDEMGLESQIEEFEVPAAEIEIAHLEVLEPYQKVYDVTAYSNCKSTPKEGIICDLEIFHSDTPVIRKQVKDKIVIFNDRSLRHRNYPALVESGVQGVIVMDGDITTHYEDVDLSQKELRVPLHQYGQLPVVNMRVHDVLEMIHKNASKVKMVIQQKKVHAKSYNLVCELPAESDDVIVCSAHYDSVQFSNGAYDNATGSVCLLAMAEYFKLHKPKRTIRFLWAGSEERGLLGSKTYCATHKEELDKVILNVNVDMLGVPLGKSMAVCTSDMSLVNYVQYDSELEGYSLEASQGVYSSDSTSFADAGVPALSFARNAMNQVAPIHSRYDVIEHLNEAILIKDIDYITHFTEKMANGYVCPVPKEIPVEMREKIDEYFGAKK